MYMYILLSTSTHTILTYKFYNMPSHNVYYASSVSFRGGEALGFPPPSDQFPPPPKILRKFN